MTESKKNHNLPSHFCKISGSAGPNVVVLGATHGDERIGVSILRKLRKFFNLPEDNRKVEKKVYQRNIQGDIYLGIGNPKAFELNQRGVSDIDLNRCFVPHRLEDTENYTQPDYQRARELAPVLRNADYLIDVHSTTNPSKQFFSLQEDSKIHSDIYKAAAVDFVSVDSDPSLIGKPFGSEVAGTTDYFVNNFGGSSWIKKKYGREAGVGLCYETGQFEDFSEIEDVFNSIKRMLSRMEVLDLANKSTTNNPEVFQLDHCEIAKSTNFEYAEHMNRNWKRVEKGDLIGVYKDLKEKVRMPQTGRILFQTHQDKIRYEGDALFYIAQKKK